jgi:hypothetical protein
MSRLFHAAASAVLLVPLAGIAQPLPARAPAASAAASSAPSGAAYRSVFDGYRGYRDEPVQSWRAANELVGRLGGWQAYAREGQGGPVAGAASAAASAPGGHTGHKAP